MDIYFIGMNFGTRIKELRKKLGLSQQELAEKLNTSQKVISDYERERTSPPKDKLPVIAKFFGLTLDALLGLDDESQDGNNGKTLHGNKRTIKAIELFDQLDPIEQRIVLRQIKALIEGKKHHLL